MHSGRIEPSQVRSALPYLTIRANWGADLSLATATGSILCPSLSAGLIHPIPRLGTPPRYPHPTNAHEGPVSRICRVCRGLDQPPSAPKRRCQAGC